MQETAECCALSAPSFPAHSLLRDLAMSSIGSISSSSLSIQIAFASGSRSAAPARSLRNDLSNFLNQQGVSAEETATILDEVKTGIANASSSSRPDFETVKSVVQEVLENHSLDADAFTSQMPTPPALGGSQSQASGLGGLSGPRVGGPPPGGRPPQGPPPSSNASASSATGSTEETEEESFLDKLLALIESLTSDSSSGTGSSSQCDDCDTSSASTSSSISISIKSTRIDFYA